MSDFNNGYTRSIPSTADMAVDAGLRSFMLGVYNKMALGLVLSGALAAAVGMVPEVTALFYQAGPGGGLRPTLLGWGVTFAPLVVLLVSGFAVRNPTARGASLVYWLVVSLMGLSLGSIFLVYTSVSVLKVFLITAAAFGGLSLWGYTTKKDISGWGSFLIMGLIGVIIAGLVNMFLRSPALDFVASIAGVLIFAGLTAHDTQQLKRMYYVTAGDRNAMGVATSSGALSLYLDFVNLMLMLLRFFGDRR